MRIVLKILFVLTIILILLLTGAFLYLRIHGKDALTSKIARELNRDVRFDAISVTFPLTVRLDNVFVEDLATAKEVTASLSLPHLLLGQARFSKIKVVEPDLRMAWDKDQPLSLAPSLRPFLSSDAQEPAQQSGFQKIPVILFVEQWIIQDGKASFFEKNDDQETLVFSLKQIELTAEKVTIPFKQPLKIGFDAKARISGFGGRLDNDQIKFFGWADFFQKDMDAKIHVEGMQGQAGLLADLVSVDNDMTVSGTMSLAFYEEPADKRPDSFEGFLIDALKVNKTRVAVDFRFKTKMDDFKIGQVSLSGSLNKSTP